MPIRDEMRETLPDVMRRAGFPIIRIERGNAMTHYFFIHPKRNTEISFCLTDASRDNPSFLMMRLSKAFREVVAILSRAEFFETVDSK
jgi:hypothetical protein